MPHDYQSSSSRVDDDDYDNFHLSSTFLPPEHVFLSKHLYSSAAEICADNIDNAPVYLCSRLPRSLPRSGLCVDEAVLDALKRFYRCMRAITGAVPSTASPYDPQALASSSRPESSIPPPTTITTLPSVLSQISTTPPFASSPTSSKRFLFPLIIILAGLYHCVFNSIIAFGAPLHFHYPVLTLISHILGFLVLLLSLFLTYVIVSSRIPSRLALSTLSSAIVPSLTAKELVRGVNRPLTLAFIAMLLLICVDGEHALSLALAAALQAMGPDAAQGMAVPVQLSTLSTYTDDSDDNLDDIFSWGVHTATADPYSAYVSSPSQPTFAPSQDLLDTAPPATSPAHTRTRTSKRSRGVTHDVSVPLDLLSSPASSSSLSALLSSILATTSPSSPSRYIAFARTPLISAHPRLWTLLSLLELPCLLLSALVFPCGLLCFTFLVYIATARVRSCWRTMSFITCPISAVHPRAADADHILSHIERQYTTPAVGIFSLLSTRYVIDLLAYVTDTAEPRLAVSGYIACVRLGVIPVLLFLLILLSLAGLQHNITYLNKVVRRFHTQCRLASAIRREWVRLWRERGEIDGQDTALVNLWIENEDKDVAAEDPSAQSGDGGFKSLIAQQYKPAEDSADEEEAPKHGKKQKKLKQRANSTSRARAHVSTADASDGSGAEDVDDLVSSRPFSSTKATKKALKQVQNRTNRARKDLYKALSQHIPAVEALGSSSNILHASPDAWVRAGLSPAQLWVAAGWGRERMEVESNSNVEAGDGGSSASNCNAKHAQLDGSSVLFPSSRTQAPSCLPISGIGAVPSAVSRGEEEAQLRQLADAARTLVSFSFLGWEVDYGGLGMFFLGMAGTATHLLKDKARELL